jgi:hypothetical protein
MTGKVLNNSTAGVLVLILPLALAITIVFTAWPFLLLLIALIVAWKVWENYQWQRWCQQVNPYFNQLITDNQGCLTAMDLSLKANLTGRSAKQFLERKAEEFGAQRKDLKDQGTVYYFLTVNALGSIFKDSDLFSDEDETEEALSLSQQPAQTNTIVETEKHSPKPSFSELAQLASQKEQTVSESEELEESEESEEIETPQDNVHVEATSDGNTLIQAELAKRLDINPSTVGRRKSDPDFPEWSQSKDPEGVAWKYVPKTKMFVRLE